MEQKYFKDYHQIGLVILMVNLIFHMSYFNFFVNISQIIYQLILSYQKLNYLR